MTTFESFSGTHPYRPECAANAVELDWHGQIPEATLQDAIRRHSTRVTELLEAGKCPRCRQRFDVTRAAGSRTTSCRCIPICSKCGEDEALQENFSKQGLAQVWQWPISASARTRRARKFEESAREVTATLADGALLTEDGVMEIPAPSTGGWAQYGYDEGDAA